MTDKIQCNYCGNNYAKGTLYCLGCGRTLASKGDIREAVNEHTDRHISTQWENIKAKLNKISFKNAIVIPRYDLSMQSSPFSRIFNWIREKLDFSWPFLEQWRNQIVRDKIRENLEKSGIPVRDKEH